MYGKKWAAKHEYEELTEETWLEPGLALLRKKVRENWTEKHRNVARKGGWTQKRVFDIGWSNFSQCQACQMEEGTEEHRLYHCPEWHAVRRHMSEVFRKLGAKGENVKERMEMAKRKGCTPLSESQWNEGHFRMKIWESEKHHSWCMQVEGFRGHVATDGSLVAGPWCSLIMMKRWGHLWDVWFNGGRKRGPAYHQEGGADGLLMLSQESDWTHQGACGSNKGLIDGVRKGEKECIKPRAGDAYLWIKN